MVLIRHNAEQRRLLTIGPLNKSSHLINFTATWDLLGPFQIGTRGKLELLTAYHQRS